MKKFKIKKGDLVQVIAGSSKGKKGEVLQVLTDTRKVLVRGVNIAITSTKPSANNPGGRINKEMPIDISNVMFVDPDFVRPSRVGFKFDDAGKKVRYSKLSGTILS